VLTNFVTRNLKDLNFNKLSFDEQLSLEGEINVNEASKVLQKMNNNKSPGSDGFYFGNYFTSKIF
jgi:hypothetical protein